MFRIVTYDINSKAYTLLKNTLGAKGIRPYDSEYVYREGDKVLNWGLYGIRQFPLIMNQWSAVATCTSKLASYRAFNTLQVPTLTWMLSRREAVQRQADGQVIYARNTDNGCMGAGITVCKQDNEIPYAKFYTVGFPIYKEYRVYVAYGQAIDIREKVKPRDMELDLMVRASDDWLYSVREPHQCLPALLTASIAACKAVGLDFCGVDVAIDMQDNVAVFEVNSAPWLGNITVHRLVSIIKEKFNES